METLGLIVCPSIRSTCRLWKSCAGQMRVRLCLAVCDATQTDHHRLLTLLCHSLLVHLAIVPVHRLASASENITSTAGLRAPRPRRWAPAGAVVATPCRPTPIATTASVGFLAVVCGGRTHV